MPDTAFLAVPQFKRWFPLGYAFMTEITRVRELSLRKFSQKSLLFTSRFFNTFIEFVPRGVPDVNCSGLQHFCHARSKKHAFLPRLTRVRLRRLGVRRNEKKAEQVKTKSPQHPHSEVLTSFSEIYFNRGRFARKVHPAWTTILQ